MTELYCVNTYLQDINDYVCLEHGYRVLNESWLFGTRFLVFVLPFSCYEKNR